MKRLSILGLALLVILVSSLAALEQVRLLMKVWASSSWPTVQARILDVSIAEGRVKSERWIRPRISYAYRVGEREFTGTHVWPFGLDTSPHPNETNNLAKAWRSQSTLAVHYNPSDPQESSVFVGFRFGWAGQLILALGGLLAGAFILWQDWYRGRRKAA